MKVANPVRYFLLTAALTVVTPALSAGAAGDAAAGKTKSATCAACHGEGGGKPLMPIYPILAGQHADYLAKAIHDYKSGARKDPIMAGMAAALTEQDIADLAAYFASQKGLSTPSPK
jgi:cytochrome c553